MRAHPVVWILRVSWLVLPFTVGDALGVALAPHSHPVSATATVVAWLVWAAVLVTSLAPHPLTLTAVRTLSPLAVGAAAWALVAAPSTMTTRTEVLGSVGLAAAVIAAVCAVSGWTADEFVDAGSYGDERRFALRTPGMFLLGPIPVMWTLTAAGLVGGPLLVASHQWVLGGLVCVATAGIGTVSARAFHGLSRRWIVFVPAGMTLVDHLALADPVLFAKARMVRFGPALADTTALDLSQNALGLALEVGLDAPTELTRRVGPRKADLSHASAVVFAAARPAAVLAEAQRRGVLVS